MINLSTKYLQGFLTNDEIIEYENKLTQAHKVLHSENYTKTDLRGWMDLPINYSEEEINYIESEADRIRKNSEILVIIGIGGSYLGARAAIEFLKSCNYNYLCKKAPKIFFIGNNISSAAISEILDICRNKDVVLNVVSKSGTTLECMVTFRIFKKFLEEKYGKYKAKERIYCTTDPCKGLLREIALKEGYKIFNIPSNVGGRYSVLTSVGLLPLSVIGGNINNLLKGASIARSRFLNLKLTENECYKYALLRNILYNKGKVIEIIGGYEPRLDCLFEWWKQLFGESEGKCGKGIFPTSVIFSTDLHSMGQFIQEGNPIFFETVITIKEDPYNLKIPYDKSDADKLNYLSSKTLEFINRQAFSAAAFAHFNSGTPIIHLEIDSIDEYNLGYLIYFFEKSCAISSHILGVDPFNQPGVEAYKKKMFALLNRPGYQ